MGGNDQKWATEGELDELEAAGLTPEGEPIAGELVERPMPGTEVEPARSGVVDAMEAATQHALATPGIAGRDEWLAMCLQARMISMSELAPKAVRGKPYDALMLLVTARDLGIPMSSAMRKVSIIEGQPSLDTQLLCALVRRQGLGSVVPHETNNEPWSDPTDAYLVTMSAVPLSPSGVPMGPPVTFSWADAIEAGYVDAGCRPGHHRVERITRKRRDGSTYSFDGCGCKDNWRGNPRDMLYWRAAARVCRFYFPEAGLGLYSAEEIANFTGADGQLIDPTTVALPEGYSDPRAQQQAASARQEERRAAAEQSAPARELWELQEQVYALPEELRGQLLERWKAHAKLRTVRITRVPVNLMATVRSMVNATWAEATKAGADRDTEVQRLQHLLAQCVIAVFVRSTNGTGSAGPVAQEPPAGPPSTDTPAEPATGHTAPDGLPAAPEYDVDPEPVDRGPEPDPDGNIPPEPEPVDWRPILRQMSDLVGPLMTELGPAGQRITAAVEKMHHTVINRLIADLEEHPEAFPPESPIGLRRMAVAYLLGTHVQNTGEMPDEVIEAEQK